jgi:hypothetical protein
VSSEDEGGGGAIPQHPRFEGKGEGETGCWKIKSCQVFETP